MAAMPLRFNTLLTDERIDLSDVRLLRHQKVSGKTPYSLWRDDIVAFDRYQAIQRSTERQRKRLKATYWASFVVSPSGGTLFVGLYEVKLNGPMPPGTIDPLTGEAPGRPGDQNPPDLYQCQRLNGMSDYIGRLSIHWGDSPSATRAWVQRADQQDKAIVELTRKFQVEAFPGFTRLSRPLSEIETMPPAWKETLRSSRGVYLLACPRTREHYVGAAYGEDGFLGRWETYAANGHGGNVGLRNRDPSDYLVSVLEVAGSAATRDDILALEQLWKRKLFSRDIGLSLN